MNPQFNKKSPEKRKWEGESKSNKSKHKKVEDSVCELMLGPAKIATLLYNNKDCSGILVLKKLTIQCALQEEKVLKSNAVQNKDINKLLLYKFKINLNAENKLGMQFVTKNVLYSIAENTNYLLISNQSKLLGKYLSENGYDYGLLNKDAVVVEDEDEQEKQKEMEESTAKYRISIQKLTEEKINLLRKLEEITIQNKQQSSTLQMLQHHNINILPNYLKALGAKEVLVTNELELDDSKDPAIPQKYLEFLCIRCCTEIRQIVNLPCSHTYYCKKCSIVVNDRKCLFCSLNIEDRVMANDTECED